MSAELHGKIAVVTGAASGIGLATTQALLAAGARVVMVDRNKDALTDLTGLQCRQLYRGRPDRHGSRRH